MTPVGGQFTLELVNEHDRTITVYWELRGETLLLVVNDEEYALQSGLDLSKQLHRFLKRTIARLIGQPVRAR